MKLYLFALLLLLIGNYPPKQTNTKFYQANHPYIHYTGRMDLSNPLKPKVWASGAYVQFKFKGGFCSAQINDEMRWGTSLNYLEIKIDEQPAYRIQLKGKTNKIVLAEGLTAGEHTLTICKNTEFENGYIEWVGFTCEAILPMPAKQARKIEFIGDSITCGAGSDESEIKCAEGKWHDQHNAWLAYGPTTARSLKAQWHLSAVSGIGLMHSCCDKKIVMPQVFDKVNMASDTIKWDFKRYQPDVVTVCLGQNDGVQDSTKFVGAYVTFARTLRNYYPKAKLVLLTSPMADKALKNALTKYIIAVQKELRLQGDNNVATYVFSQQYHQGCGGHPSIGEHQQIAAELSAFLRKTMKW